MKKRLISLVLVICIVISAIVVITQAASSFNGKVTAEVLNVRSGPGTGYSIVGKLNLNS